MTSTLRPIQPIRTEADYESALREIDLCLDADEGSPEFERLEVLSILVDDYEAKHHDIGPPDPIAAIQFALEQRGLTRKDLGDVIGSSGRISEVMNKQRPLTLAMIRKLIAKFDIPAAVLVRSSEAPSAKEISTNVSPRGQSHTGHRTNRPKTGVAAV
ncbi:type II toxin-antitoxin system HigA family antitoxin [Synechococcus sp. CS-1328]|uniref:helix-turn-helix domain-containing protein n=1 Tax=Synechococcus sp. CS-1328 TaxID=2847976 RepID=UPI00223AD569|nr:helix-turn-helix domain-containing protein [Synechococcus sp. CS-1328]MCT0225548.1 helix-turn-helix domain-containing protein [Synechococcus sp. CS-1328]